MATPQTFNRQANGDLSLDGGGLSLTATLAEYVRWHIQECLSLFAGEWYLDTREGIPYFKVVQGRPDLALLRSLYRRAVLAVPGVADVTRIDLQFDGATRELAVLIDCTLTDGEVITAAPYLVPWVITNAGAGAEA